MRQLKAELDNQFMKSSHIYMNQETYDDILAWNGNGSK
jgi:hypothetical protein